MEEGEDFSAPKTNAGIRDIDLDVGTAEILRSHGEAQRFERRRWGDGYQDRGLVFAQPNGDALDHDALRKRFTRRVRKAKLRAIHFHDMRHTHATLLREEGVDMQVISRRLGHSSETITYRLYGHVTPKLSRTAATAIGNLIDGPGPAPARQDTETGAHGDAPE